MRWGAARRTGAKSAAAVPEPSLVAPHPSGSSVALDRAPNGCGAISWSPDGATLAAVAYPAEGSAIPEIRLYRGDGSRVATRTGDAYAWIDRGELAVMVVERVDGASSGAGSVAIYRTDGQLETELPGRWQQTLVGAGGLTASGDGPGELALSLPDGTAFRIWSPAGGLSASIPGRPAAWSPDGTRLALWLPALAAARLPTIQLATTGGAQPGVVGILDARTLRMIASFRDHPLDDRFPPFWSPDGSWLAGDGGAPPYALTALPVPRPRAGDRSVQVLPNAAVPFGWTAGGALVHAGRPPHAWEPGTTPPLDPPWDATLVTDPCGGRLYLDRDGRPLAEFSGDAWLSLQRPAGRMAATEIRLAYQCWTNEYPDRGLWLVELKTLPAAEP